MEARQDLGSVNPVRSHLRIPSTEERISDEGRLEVASRVENIHPTRPPRWGWQFEAACLEADAALFFAPSYFEKREEKQAREARAKVFCRRCRVREECLEYALSIREPHGIWGGLNEMERRALLRGRAREAG